MQTSRIAVMALTATAAAGLSWICGCKQSEQSPPSAKPAATSPAAAAPAASTVPLVAVGLPPVAVPADNPQTAEKIELGKMLYFDKRLSKDHDISCATCHDPATAWTEHTPNSKGIHGQHGDRNAPTVINAAYMPVQFWDGRAASLEEQALGPIQNPIEMGNTMQACLDALSKIPEYQKRFKAVFGSDKITEKEVAQAIAAFERTVLSGNSAYDKFNAGQKDALTDAQKRGMEIFMDRGQCSVCHTPPTFSGGSFQNAGVGAGKDPGRMKVTKRDSDAGRFRVPTLREVANTHPYFHDGSVVGLEEAVKVMAAGGVDNPHLSSVLKSVRDAKLTDQDVKDLVAFLGALSGEFPRMDPPVLPQ